MPTKDTVVKRVTRKREALRFWDIVNFIESRTKDVKDLNRALRKWVYKYRRLTKVRDRYKQENNWLRNQNNSLISMLAESDKCPPNTKCEHEDKSKHTCTACWKNWYV